MRSTPAGMFRGGNGLWGEGKWVRRKMKGVEGERTDCGLVRKEKSKNGRLWGTRNTVRKKMNYVGGERTADGSAEKRAKMRRVATQWAPEGNEWRIQTHQA